MSVPAGQEEGRAQELGGKNAFSIKRHPGMAQFLSLPVGGDRVGRLAFTEDAEPWGQFICDKREVQ